MTRPLELSRGQTWDELESAISIFTPEVPVFGGELVRLRRQLILWTQDMRQRLTVDPQNPAGLRILLDSFRIVTRHLRDLEKSGRAFLIPMYASGPTDGGVPGRLPPSQPPL